MTAEPASEIAYKALLTRLRRGIYPAGTRLPGERALAAEVKVSRSTLRQALTRLADEGALVASPQRGWYVPQVVLGEPPSTLISFTDMARARGLRATATVLSRNVRPATFGEAEDLQVAPAAPVLELVRLRGMDGVPVTLEQAVLPWRLFDWLEEIDLTDASLYQLTADHGIQVHRSSYTVQAVNADERVAGLLHVPVGAAVLLARDVTYAVDQQPVMVTVNSYRGDAYRFTADLFAAVGSVSR